MLTLKFERVARSQSARPKPLQSFCAKKKSNTYSPVPTTLVWEQSVIPYLHPVLATAAVGTPRIT